MKYRILFIPGIFMFTLFLLPVQKIAVLPLLEKPMAMELDREHLYVLDNYSIYLFSSSNFKLLKKFGKKGEGPAEWSIPFNLKLYPGSIVLNDLRKLLVFSRDGNLEYELKKKNISLMTIWPVGKQFVGFRGNPGNKNSSLTFSILILNKNLENIKEIALLRDSSIKKSTTDRTIDAFGHNINFRVYDDLIFVGDSTKGFYIEVFDSEGKLLYKIDKASEVKPVPVTGKIKSEFLKKNKESDDMQIGNMFGVRSKYTFPEYFPAFNKFYIDGGKIYAITYITKSEKSEVIVMDLKGKILKRVFLDLNGECLKVFDNAFYYLRDNIIDETWELFRELVD